MIKFSSFLMFAFVSMVCFSQTDNKSKYDPHPLFTPLLYPSSVNDYRAATGEPGPKYWQNKASYQINASLDDVNDAITGSVTVTYTNNSPHTLPFLWRTILSATRL